MKHTILFLAIIASFSSFGQETFYKSYKVYNFIDFLDDDVATYDFEKLTKSQEQKVKFLMKEVCTNYKDLKPENKNKIDNELKLIKKGVLVQKVYGCNGVSILVDKSNVDKSEVLDLISMKEKLRASTFASSNKNEEYLEAGLIFEKNRIYVNLWPFVNKMQVVENQSQKGLFKSYETEEEEEDVNIKKDTEIELFYEIPDDHTAKFDFTEITITAITIPLKYRFSTNRQALDTSDENNITEINVTSDEFSSSINLAFFIGHTWGRTKFTHRKKIGNKTSTFKHTLGAFLGSSALELSSSNTNITLNQPQSEIEGTFGTVSFGLGYVFSWNKISVGLFSGIDKGVGRVSESWIYDGDIWLGFGVGYDLFKL